MSIITGQYFDIPDDEHGYEHFQQTGDKTIRRSFFQSSARWDEDVQQIVMGREKLASPWDVGDRAGVTSVGEMMERGGRSGDEMGEEDEYEDEMTVDL